MIKKVLAHPGIVVLNFALLGVSIMLVGILIGMSNIGPQTLDVSSLCKLLEQAK